MQLAKVPHRRYVFTASAVLLTAALATSCAAGDDPAHDFVGDVPNAEPIQALMRTAVPLAYAASVAMAAAHDAAPSNATTNNTCSDYPCVALVTIDLDAQSLPVALPAYGDILVAGVWQSERQAILTVSFVDMTAGSTNHSVHTVSTVPATGTADGVSIVYASVDINIESGPVLFINPSLGEVQAELDRLDIQPSNNPSVSVGTDAWLIHADHAATPDDFADDRYTLSGGGQYLDASAAYAAVLQLGAANVEIGPACAANPVNGLAVLQQVNASQQSVVLGSAMLQFDTVCDGTADVIFALGVYAGTNGASIALGL